MDIIQVVQKWGNGTGIRLPKHVLETGGIGIGQRVSLKLQGNSIVLTPIKDQPSITLNNLLKGVTPEQVGGEVSWGTDIGQEQYE